MVTCNFLGELGNNLFQTATLIELSYKHNIPFQLINNRNCYVPIKDRPLELTEMFEYSFQYYEGTTSHFTHYKSPDTQGTFEYTPINLNSSQNTIIEGYFQSEKYFETTKEDITNHYFKPKQTHINYISDKYGFIINQNNILDNVFEAFN